MSAAENGEAAVTEATPQPSQVVVRKSPKALSQRDPAQIAKAFAESGYFPDTRKAAQAVVKIVAGEELGLGPMASVQGLTMIEGKLGFTGNLVATLIKQHPTYDYKVVETKNERCEIEFFDRGELVGSSEFTIEDAERAGLVKYKSGWKKYPKAMCFNRALTQGVRTYIPDVTAGTPAYTDDEIEEVITTTAVEEEADPVVALSDATVEQLAKGIDAAGLSLDDLNMELGALGIDAFDPNGVVRDQLAALTPEQAVKLDAALQVKVDAQAGDDDDGE